MEGSFLSSCLDFSWIGSAILLIFCYLVERSTFFRSSDYFGMLSWEKRGQVNLILHQRRSYLWGYYYSEHSLVLCHYLPQFSKFVVFCWPLSLASFLKRAMDSQRLLSTSSHFDYCFLCYFQIFDSGQQANLVFNFELLSSCRITSISASVRKIVVKLLSRSTRLNCRCLVPISGISLLKIYSLAYFLFL